MVCSMSASLLVIQESFKGWKFSFTYFTEMYCRTQSVILTRDKPNAQLEALVSRNLVIGLLIEKIIGGDSPTQPPNT